MSPSQRQHTVIEDPDLFMAMDDLELVARGVVEGALHGLHRSPYLGFSAEFDAHREYQPGDDLRHVNWNLWAHRPALRQTVQVDTNLNLYLLLDCSGSMAVRTARRNGAMGPGRQRRCTTCRSWRGMLPAPSDQRRGAGPCAIRCAGSCARSPPCWARLITAESPGAGTRRSAAALPAARSRRADLRSVR